MKKTFITLFGLIVFNSNLFAQIKKIKEDGFTINVYGASGNKTTSRILTEQEEYLGHNSSFFLIRRLNSIYVFDHKGREYQNSPISVANNRSFSQITEKSIWIEEGSRIHYYDFKGKRLSNYSED